MIWRCASGLIKSECTWTAGVEELGRRKIEMN